MTFPRVEKQRQVVYTNSQAARPKTASSTTAPLLSFKSTQNNTGLSIEHTTKPKQQYVQAYVKVKSKDGKTYNFNATLEKRINNVTAKLQKAEKENGLIGKTWSWTKNTIGFGDSSNKVKEIQANERKLLAQFNTNEKTRAKVFKQLTGCEYNKENLEKFIKGQIKLKSEIAIQKYKEGQEMAVDITSDIVSGVVAYGTATACIAGGIAAAPFTAGASLGAVAVGVGVAVGAGAATKVAIKGGEAAIGGKKYSWKQAGKDATIGAVSGALAPVTIGAGGAVANSVGKVAPKFIATSARLAVEGGTFGAVDGGTRSALEGDSIGDVALNTIKGAGMGIVAGNVLGHGGSTLGKGSQYIYEKFTPVYKGNGFTYRKNLLGKKYKLQLDRPDIEPLQFDLPSLKQPNPHPTNLTNELTRVPYYGGQVRTLLSDNPNLSPIVGSLPQKWGRKLASKKGLEQIDQIFYNLSSLYYKGTLTTAELNVAQTNLSKILNSEVVIKELGAGNIGKAFIITVDNQSFVLKCFRPIERREWQGIHGNYNELSMAVYASKHDANSYAPFYMGRFGDNNDGYILTKYIEGSHPSEGSVKNFSFKKHVHSTLSSDIKADNIKGKKQIDYGAIEINEVINRFSAKEKSILSKIAVALDDNNIKMIEEILKKERGSQEFLNVQKFIQKLVNNYSAQPKYGINAGLTIEYFIERQSALEKIGVKSIPNIGVYKKSPERLYYPSSELSGYYGLNRGEWYNLGLNN